MTPWLLLVLSLAALKIGLGAVGSVYSGLLRSSTPVAVPAAFGLLHMLVWGTAGLFLVTHRRRDARALWLGAAYSLVAVTPSDRLFAGLGSAAAWVDRVVLVLEHLHPDAFLPLCFWLFFRSFPGGQPSHRLARVGVWSSALGGALLFAVHASPLLTVGPLREALGPALEPLRPSPSLYLYTWAFIMGLTVPAFVFAAVRVRSAPLQERRRAALFIGGIIAGSLPFWLAILVSAISPSARAFLDDPSRAWMSAYTVRLAFMTIPFTTAYSVLVHQVLDIRLVVRQALQYALARYAVLVATGVPFLVLIVYLYGNRDATIAELLTGTGTVILIAATAAGLVLLQLRGNVLAAIDRRFFREHYDAQRILMSLVEGSRRASSPRELADLLCTEIDRALHLERVAVFVLDAARGELRSGGTEAVSLSVASSLATLVSHEEQPLDIDWGQERTGLGRLDEDDREWLRSSGFRLLIPLTASEGTLVGIVALGPKRSELPFSKEDRSLLTTIAASASLNLENRIKVSSPGDWSAGPGAGEGVSAALALARECAACGRVVASERTRCPLCAGELTPSAVPHVLHSKFRFEQRIGAGGMGIVYRALDLTLGRRVAIKTLPRISPEFAARLRREARVMAAVAHPNLAVVFGVETLRGAPLLIVELLEGGTLGSRLRAAPLPTLEVVELGIILAEALDVIHAAGVLHRDIKPTNVGYSTSGVPKLLDFGLAKILDDSRTAASVLEILYDDLDEVPVTALTELTVTRRLVGTPIYLSPEAACGEDPSPGFDLWALGVTLFEAVSGTHPLRIQDTKGLRARIFEGDVAELGDVWPESPEPLRRFFAEALARDPDRRPRSALELKGALEGLRKELGG